MARLTRERNETQPIKTKNCGSVFKNPPGDSAGRLVQAAGLKGAREGAAVVSTLHGNFIVNEGGATAADVRRVDRARDGRGQATFRDPARAGGRDGGPLELRLAVLRGGSRPSARCRCAPGEQVAKALRGRGHEVAPVDLDGATWTRSATAASTACSTRSTAGWARTGRCRECSSCSDFHTQARGCLPPPCAWTSRAPTR